MEKKFGGALFSNPGLLEGRPSRRKSEESGWDVAVRLARHEPLRLAHHSPIKQTHLGALHENVAKQSYLTAYDIIAWNTNTGKALPTLPSLEPLWSVNWMEKLPSGDSLPSYLAKP